MTDYSIGKVRIIFGIVCCLIYVMIVAALLFKDIPEANRSSVDILIGTLSGTMGTIFSFFFGSSHGSVRKSEVIENAKVTLLKDKLSESNHANEDYLNEEPEELQTAESELEDEGVIEQVDTKEPMDEASPIVPTPPSMSTKLSKE